MNFLLRKMPRGQYFLHEQVASELTSLESSEAPSSACIRSRLLDHGDFDDLILRGFLVWTYGRRKTLHADVDSEGRVGGDLTVDHPLPTSKN